MFQQALKRLFLVLFPVILFVTALYLSHIHPPKQDSAPQQHTANNCPFYLGISFFSQKEIFQPNKLTTYTLNESDFIKKTQNLNSIFQKENLSLKQIFFSLPLTLTKEEEWIISQKTFFILPTGERKQISHLTYSEINDFHNFLYPTDLNSTNQDYKTLKLDKVLSLLPKKSNFLFYLIGSDRKKIIKNLNKIQNKIQGDLYLSSYNEKLLKDLLLYQSCSNSNSLSKDLHKQQKTKPDFALKNQDLFVPEDYQRQKKEECSAEALNRTSLSVEKLNQPLKTNIKILHSFKAFIRLEMLSVLPQSFKNIRGQGIIIPNSFSPSPEISSFLKQKNKLLFFEKEPPYTKQDKHWIQSSQALISSQVKLAISSIKDKKTCLIKD